MKYVITISDGERAEFVEHGDKFQVTVFRGQLDNKVAVFKIDKSDLTKIVKAVN